MTHDAGFIVEVVRHGDLLPLSFKFLKLKVLSTKKSSITSFFSNFTIADKILCCTETASRNSMPAVKNALKGPQTKKTVWTFRHFPGYFWTIAYVAYVAYVVMHCINFTEQ